MQFALGGQNKVWAISCSLRKFGLSAFTFVTIAVWNYLASLVSNNSQLPVAAISLKKILFEHQDRSNAQVSCAGLFIFSHIGFDFPGTWLHIDMATPVHMVSFGLYFF